MPLFVGEELVGNDCKSSSELFARFPKLKTKSCKFVSRASSSFQGEKIVYVGQCEYGTAHPSDTSVSVLGSDGATTCQLVVLRHTVSGACSLSHLDGCKVQQALADMVKSLLRYSTTDDKSRIEMHIVGGFLDDRKLSEDTFLKILKGANDLSVTVELVCASVCALNDRIVNGKHVPIVYGLGVFVENGTIVPVPQFECHIPDESLRHVALWGEPKYVRQVYSSLTQELTVGPVQVYLPAREARKQASLPDELMRQLFSTSPHCEPANFSQKLKEAFLFAAENPNLGEKFFPRNKPRRFKRKKNGDWYLIDEN